MNINIDLQINSRNLFNNYIGGKLETPLDLTLVFQNVTSKFKNLKDLLAMRTVCKQWQENIKKICNFNDKNQSLWMISLIYHLKKSNPSRESLADFLKSPHAEGKIMKVFKIIYQSNLVDAAKEIINSPYFEKEVGYNWMIYRTIEKDWIEMIKYLLQDDRIDIVNNRFIQFAADKSCIEIVKLLLQNSQVKVDTDIIRWQIQNGHDEIAKLLLQHNYVISATPTDYIIKYAIIDAIYYGCIEVFKMLLKNDHVDLITNDNEAIQMASSKGRTEMAKLLLKDSRVNPAANYSGAIRWAAYEGYIEIVKLLLQDNRVDPTAIDPEMKNNSAIHAAIEKGNLEIIKLLVQDSRVNPNIANNNFPMRWTSIDGKSEVIKYPAVIIDLSPSQCMLQQKITINLLDKREDIMHQQIINKPSTN